MLEILEAHADQFLIRQKGYMSVRENNLKFNFFARYAPYVVATMDDRFHRYVYILYSFLVEIVPLLQ